MSDSETKTGGWVNNIAKMWKKKDKEGYFLSLPIAEPVTIVLQRKIKEGFVNQEVTLVPQENEKGYKSVMFTMKKPEAYQYNGETISPPQTLKFECSLPPQGSGDGESDF